ncbi:MAG: peptidoglycan DD-metalloendopeptidase family protein [Gammaproteobacteria bacterium]|nr:peptidoglycan DD-metalloendopeptidase family protein [Gammaproteobacteria bacterium]
MNELATKLILAGCYSVLVTGIAYAVLRLLARCLAAVRQWKFIWLAAIGLGLWLFGLTAISDRPLLDAEPTLGFLTHPVEFDVITRPLAELESASRARLSFLPPSVVTIYTLGILVMLAKSVLAWDARRRLVAATRDASPAELTEVRQWVRQFCALTGIAEPAIRVSTRHVSPYTVAAPRPTIVLTEFALQRLQREELRLVILHELVHLQCSDHFMQYLLEFGTAVLWFNPFVHLLARDYGLACELHCDSQVLTRYNGRSDTYREAFLAIIRGSLDRSYATQTVTHGFSGRYRARAIMRRLANIQNPLAPRRTFIPRALCGLGAMLLAVTASFAKPGLEHSEGGSRGFISPLLRHARIVSPMGMRVSAFDSSRIVMHEGVDLDVPTDTTVVAVQDGIVEFTQYNDDFPYGLHVVLSHSNGFRTRYANLNEVLVDAGDLVRQGDVIGRTGASGASLEPHLHFELRRGDVALDPEGFIDFNAGRR